MGEPPMALNEMATCFISKLRKERRPLALEFVRDLQKKNEKDVWEKVWKRYVDEDLDVSNPNLVNSTGNESISLTEVSEATAKVLKSEAGHVRKRQRTSDTPARGVNRMPMSQQQKVPWNQRNRSRDDMLGSGGSKPPPSSNRRPENTQQQQQTDRRGKKPKKSKALQNLWFRLVCE